LHLGVENFPTKAFKRILDMFYPITQMGKIILVEQRKDVRKKLNKTQPIVAACKTKDFDFKASIDDLSSGGVFINTRRHLSAGQEIAMIFSFPKVKNPILATGEIVRVSGEGVGVEFKIFFKDKNYIVQNSEKRDDARIIYKSPAEIENLKSGITYGARMVNYSRNGLCLETNEILHKGTEIYIGIESSPYTSASFSSYECYRAKILWHKKLEAAFLKYAYGVRYIFAYDEKISQSDNLKGRKDLRKRCRQSYSTSILVAIQNRLFEALTQNISPIGAFIKTNNYLKAGQTLTLAIPLKGNQTALIKGRVVWSYEVGFGVNFLNIEKRCYNQ
jgi:Tfp pilus assembly protein PilZ